METFNNVLRSNALYYINRDVASFFSLRNLAPATRFFCLIPEPELAIPPLRVLKMLSGHLCVVVYTLIGRTRQPQVLLDPTGFWLVHGK